MRARAQLLPLLRERLATQPLATLTTLFERHGLPYAPIVRPEQLYDDPHLNASGGLAEITLPDGARAGHSVRTTLLPLRLDGQRPAVRHNPPHKGEHTQVLLQALGYSAAEIEALYERKIVL